MDAINQHGQAAAVVSTQTTPSPWTKDNPAVGGFYWLRARKSAAYQWGAAHMVFVEIPEGQPPRFVLLGQHVTNPLTSMDDVQWHGPLRPPE